jgi:hypothetical protein
MSRETRATIGCPCPSYSHLNFAAFTQVPLPASLGQRGPAVGQAHPRNGRMRSIRFPLRGSDGNWQEGGGLQILLRLASSPIWLMTPGTYRRPRSRAIGDYRLLPSEPPRYCAAARGGKRRRQQKGQLREGRLQEASDSLPKVARRAIRGL